MKKYVNGVLMDMTPEEEAAYKKMQDSFPSESTPSPEERLDTMEADMKQVKSDVDDLGYILTGEVLSNAQ